MPKWRIEHEIEQEGVRFHLTESALLRSKSHVPIENWGLCGKNSDLPGVAQLLAWCDEDFVQSDNSSVLVPHEAIANMTASTAAAVNLPLTAPYLLNLQHAGTLDQPKFQFRTTWLQATGQRLMGATQLGAFLQVGSRSYRIPIEVYQLLEATKAFNDSSEEGEQARLYHWAIVQEHLPEASTRSIKADGYIQSTRIGHAAAFSLDLKTGADGFTFDPVLFGSRIVAENAAKAGEDDDQGVISEAQQLLPDAQQKVFSKERFEKFGDCQSRYALGDGWYVVFDEDTRQALNVVRKVQQSDRDTRRKFAKNPRSFIRKELGEDFDEQRLEGLFIETSEYSQRIKDVGLWQATVIPWVARANESWLPERFGLRIGDKYVTVSPTDVSQLKKIAQEAVNSGAATFEWNGESIPASNETLSAIERLVGLEIPDRSEGQVPNDESSEEESETPPGPIVLVIDQNFDEVEYTRVLKRRSDCVDDELPLSLKTSLKAHQIDGLRWLKESWSSGSSGVLLADDMGLGKTLQALAFLAWLREKMDSRSLRHSPILMVAPTGLLTNWREEVSKHFYSPGLGNELIAYGRDLKSLRSKSGRETDIGEAVLDSHELQRSDWIMTTYETLRDYQHSFGAIRFAAIVYDEVQKIKTPGKNMTDAAKAMNGDFVLALTGTPVENRLADLWCIMDTLQPGGLGGLKEFSARYEKDPLEEDLKALKDQLMLPKEDKPASMLRRMKAGSLKGLPDKFEHPVHKIMPAAQAEIYSEAIAMAKSSKDKGGMLKALQSFKSISLHPTHPDQAESSSYIKDSARLTATFEILDQIKEKGEKALVFLESREMQPVVAGLIQRRYKLPKQPMLISGAVSGAKRQSRVNEFQKARKDFDVIILSPRAGGVGLTLTAANHVIHLSRWWNPAVEDQCTDRVYRIGQKREVHVYYPMAIHPEFADSSFDVRLHTLLESKRSLSREMLMPPVEEKADSKNLFGQTIGQTSDDDTTNDSAETTLEKIDVMEPLQFEDWVLEKLNENGFDVCRTPPSHDHGADGTAISKATGTKLIIQCKHIQRDALCDETAVEDLLRAKPSYQGDTLVYLAVTNARGFSRKAKRIASKENIRLIARNELRSWPSNVRSL